MRSVWLALVPCLWVCGYSQVGEASAVQPRIASVRAAQWKAVAEAFRSRDGKRIAALVEPGSGLLVRSANGNGHPTKQVSPREIVSYFQRVQASHDDPRSAGPLGFATTLPKKMPTPDSQGRYFFDTGHKPGRGDDSYVRFAYHHQKLWLTEVTAWSEMGRMP